MSNWLLRGLVFAGAMVFIRVTQGALIDLMPTHASAISMGLLILGAPWAILWGIVDGRADAHAHPDPDRRDDLPMTWLLAGLVSGVVGGAVTWLLSLIDKALYVGGLLNELTTFAAFTALIVFVPAVAGVAIGRQLVDRGYSKQPVRHHGLAAQELGQTDTDVFAAVGAGTAATAPIGDANATAQTGPVTTSPITTWTAEEFPTDPGSTTASDVSAEDTGRHEQS